LQRKRTHNWPYSRFLNEISTPEGIVVPVANVKNQFREFASE
jgi:hypothetical protein